MTRRLLILASLVAVAVLVPQPAAAGAGFAHFPSTASEGDDDSSFVYSDLLRAARRGEVQRAAFGPRSGEATVWLSGGRREEVELPPGTDLADRLSAAGARVEVRQPSRSAWLLEILTPLILVAALGALFLRSRRRRRGVDSPPRESAAPRAGPSTPPRPAVRFADVAGCDEAVDEVREFVTFLRDPGRFMRVGARMPTGLLLHGPPGTGKTMLAKAMAAEADVTFFAASGSDFMDRYVGVGATRVRELFAKARRASRGAVVFIDELDAIGKRRSDASDAGHGERDHTLNQLLVELDGFESRHRVVCVAATNRMELLDPALVRPGRLSRHVLVDLPSAEGRRAILNVHARGKPLAEDVDLDRVAAGTAGRSGADLAELVNEAALMAARADRDRITSADLDEGHLRVLAGPPKRSSPLSDAERRLVAHHEAGHALVAELCPTQDKAHRLTIRPRGRAAGLAVTSRRDRTLHSTRYVHEQLMVLLGGRAAEHAVYGNVTSGAANDLQQANALARSAVTELGFSPRAGQLVERLAGRGLRLAESTHQVIDEEVDRMIADAYRDAIAMIDRHRAPLDRLARTLMENEELDRLEIAAALGRTRPPVPAHPNPGSRPESALRARKAPKRQVVRARRPLRQRVVPALAALLPASARLADRERRAPTA